MDINNREKQDQYSDVEINQRITILNNSNLDKSSRDAQQSITGINVTQGPVKIIVHESVGQSAESFGEEGSSELGLSALQQFRNQKLEKIGQQMGQFQKQYDESKAAAQIQMGENMPQKSTLYTGGSALQTEAFKAQMVTKDSGDRKQQASSKTQKKVPRKRYFNGYGKVPGVVEPVQKDLNSKTSRAFSGKTWNRGASARDTVGISSRSNLRQDGFNFTQMQTYQKHQSQNRFAFNFAAQSEVQSQLSENSPIKQMDKTTNSQALERGIKVLSDNDQDTEFETLASNKNVLASRIHVHSNHVTLDPGLALKLARDGALVGLSNLQKEVKMVQPGGGQSESEKGIQFTLDQYKWAQKQNIYEHKQSIGKNPIGRQIQSSNLNQRARRSQQSIINTGPQNDVPSISNSDFMVEEAAVSHLMHRADNIPKIKFQLICENEYDSSNQICGETSMEYRQNTEFQGRNQPIIQTNQFQTGRNSGSYSSAALRSNLPIDINTMSPIGIFLLSDNQQKSNPNIIQEDQFSSQINGEQYQLASQNLSMTNIGVSLNSRQAASGRTKSQQSIQRQSYGTQIGQQNNYVQVQDGEQGIYVIDPSPQFRNKPQTAKSMRNIQNVQQPFSAVPLNVGDFDKYSNMQYQGAQSGPGRGFNTQISKHSKSGRIMHLRKGAQRYKPKEGELVEGDLILSSGNQFHELKNPHLSRFMASIQDNIATSHNKRYEMRTGKDKIFEMFKKSQSFFHKTMIEGERLGHCTGVSSRDNPTQLYQNRLRTQRFLQKQEDRYEEIRARKPQEQKAKFDAQIRRTQQKIYQIEQAKKIVPDLVKLNKIQDAQNFRHLSSDQNNSPRIQTKSPRSPVLDQETSQKSSPKFEKQKRNSNRASPVQQQSQDSNKQCLIKAKKVQINLTRENTNDISPKNLKSEDSKNFDFQLNSVQNSPINQRRPSKIQKESAQQLDFADSITSPTLSRASISKNKKQMLQSAKKLKVLKDNLGLKGISILQSNMMEKQLLGQGTSTSLLQSQSLSNASALQKIYKYLSCDQFLSFKQSHCRQPGMVSKRNLIFKTQEQLGLEDRPDFNQFFNILCDDPSSHNPKLDRLKYKEFLQDRYSKIVGEKVLSFFENKFQTLFTFDKRGYCNVIMEFLNLGPELYKRLLFGCLNFSNSQQICEHDIFQLLENFKQRDSYFFYKELITQKDVPRNFADAIDLSDDIFFEAFSTDVKSIARALCLRKRICGIKDTDTAQSYEDDILRSQFASDDSYEECLVNQIDYIIGIMTKKVSSTSLQQEIADILIRENDLKDIKNALIELILQKQILTIKEKRVDQSISGADSKKNSYVPCLGTGIVSSSGRKISTDCCFLTFEDFNKLVIFKKGKQSSFVEDLIDHMTNCLISVHDVEVWMSQYRDPLNRNVFSGKSLLEHVAQMNTREYGNSRGLPPLQAKVKKQRLGITAEILPHQIKTVYTIQDHYMGDDFVGKLLIRKIPAKDLQRFEIKEKSKDDDSQNSPEKGTESDNEEDLENETGDDKGSPEIQAKEKMILNTSLIHDNYIYELIHFRQFFGVPNFFRIFRIFYQLSNIPEDTQNNPFALYLDEASMIRNFESVFGIENEEVAVRFFKLFIAPLGQPKMYKVDICRWFFVIENFTDNLKPKQNKNFMKLAFNFLDYDANGYIGSVDILNLKNSLSQESLDKVQKIFFTNSVKKNLASKMSKLQSEIKQQHIYKHKKESLMNSDLGSASVLSNFVPKPILQKKVTTKLDVSALPNENSVEKNVTIIEEIKNEDSQNSSPINSEDEKSSYANVSEILTKDEYQQEKNLPEEERFARDPWNCFQMEVQILRDHYVDAAVKTSKPKTTNYEFLNLKRYELFFLPMFASKFNIQNTPTIVHFFKKILIYQFELSDDLLQEKGSPYYGYTKNGHKNPCEVEVTPELHQIQAMLDEMSKHPKPASAYE